MEIMDAEALDCAQYCIMGTTQKHFIIMLVNASDTPTSIALLGLYPTPSAGPTDKAYLLQASQLCPFLGES